MDAPHWIGMEVTARPDYTLLLHVADGTTRFFNALPLLEKPIYQSLQSPDFFLTAHVECGTVVWSDVVDIAPEYLYEHSKAHVAPTSTSWSARTSCPSLWKEGKNRSCQIVRWRNGFFP